jgi:hypothetical protein
MINDEIKQYFKNYLEKFTDRFQKELNPEIMADLKAEINNLNQEDVIDCWVLLLNVQGPVEKISDNKYEIYDVSNFMDEITGQSEDYIHTVEFDDEESNASIFMKFYLVFHCLINGTKSNEYKLTKTRSESA